MDLILETPRLVMRPTRPENRPLIRALLTDGQVMQHIREPFSESQVDRMMPDIVRRGAFGALGSWCIFEKADGTPVGETILLPMPVEQDYTDWSSVVWDRYPNGEVELGYQLLPSAWGKGYATETTIRLLRFAFGETRLERVLAVTDPGNAASQKVLLKAGMSPIGAIRAYGGDCPAFQASCDTWKREPAPVSQQP